MSSNFVGVLCRGVWYNLGILRHQTTPIVWFGDHIHRIFCHDEQMGTTGPKGPSTYALVVGLPMATNRGTKHDETNVGGRVSKGTVQGTYGSPQQPSLC